MIAGPRGDGRLGREGTLDQRDFSATNRQRAIDRMHNERLNANMAVNLRSQCRQALTRTVARIEREDLANLPGFFLVQSQYDIEVFPEAADQLKRALDV